MLASSVVSDITHHLRSGWADFARADGTVSTVSCDWYSRGDTGAYKYLLAVQRPHADISTGS